MAPKKAVEEVPKEPEIVQGTGKFIYKIGATYEGEYLQKNIPDAPPEASKIRFRHGKGTYTEGAYSYEGSWEEDAMQGKGKMTFASGAVYEGDFVKDKFHGKGTYRWPDGRVYEGDFFENKPHGNGTFKDVSGQTFTGQFFNGTGPGLTMRISKD